MRAQSIGKGPGCLEELQHICANTYEEDAFFGEGPTTNNYDPHLQRKQAEASEFK